MNSKPSLAAIILAIIGLLFLHLLGLHFYLYWTVWWFDVLMHFLGGFWVGFTALWLYHFVGKPPRHNRDLAVALLAAIIVGVMWELYEYTTGVTFSLVGYRLDTATDLAMDLVGGYCAFRYVLYKKWPHASAEISDQAPSQK
jgi:RsiW-degrading membrane proteinase PrsW (M82 family)